ncbi:MAG: hypothetical protein WB762_08360 [Candidatus Sulfotelmatobacter sp.]
MLCVRHRDYPAWLELRKVYPLPTNIRAVTPALGEYVPEEAGAHPEGVWQVGV